METAPKHKSFWVEFLYDRSVMIREGQTILQASIEAGIPLYHDCGGKGRCSTCRVLINEGLENVSSFSPRERVLRRHIGFPENIRLGCQTFITGPSVKLQRIIRDETDLEMYIDRDHSIDTDQGVEQRMALFFLDIRDFTPFIENYLPFDVIHVMRRLFAIYQSVIHKHHGVIVETAGDGFYAVFGFHTDLKKAINNAYNAALEIFEEVKIFNDQYLEKYFSHRFEIGIGIHAGKVIVGCIGINVNNNLSVMGRAVIIASRIQNATKDLNNSFLITDLVYDLLEQQPLAEHRHLKLKGIRNKVSVYLCGSAYPYNPNLATTQSEPADVTAAGSQNVEQGTRNNE